MGIRPVEAPSSSILVREQMVLEDQSEWVRGQGGSCVADIIEARAEKKGQDVLDCRSRLDALQARSLQSISISYPTISGRGLTHLRCCTTDGIGIRPRAICVHHRDTRHPCTSASLPHTAAVTNSSFILRNLRTFAHSPVQRTTASL